MRLGSGVVFLYVGRLWKGKGIDFLLDAFEQLSETGIDASLTILISVVDRLDEARYRRQGRIERGRVSISFPFLKGAALLRLRCGGRLRVSHAR